VRRAEVTLAGLEKAFDEIETELRAEFAVRAAEGVQIAVDESAKARRRFEDAIASLEDAAQEFGGSLAMLSGWRSYLTDRQKTITFQIGAVGSYISNGAGGWLEPPSVPSLTATLRDYSTWASVIIEQIHDAEARNAAPVPTATVTIPA
jgi:hypothetical protein